jgi:pyruvate dehydrogenase E2 component (dihydrolipoamide acetyltransferase)
VVPVLRDVDQKGIFELAQELAEVAEKARLRKLKPTDMQGAVFSLSSLGGIGGTSFTPIVNVPEVAILGLSKLQVEPRWSGSLDPESGGEFVPRTILPLSLSYDHRVIDGAAAARFTTRLGQLLSDPAYLLL